MSPQIKYKPRAECTIEDDGDTISLYVEINPDPNRSIRETEILRCLAATMDIDNKGNCRGIEILLDRGDPGDTSPLDDQRRKFEELFDQLDGMITAAERYPRGKEEQQ